MKETPATIMKQAIAANIAVLAIKLHDAAMHAADARQAMDAGNQNLAIGMLLDFEDMPPEMQALFSIILLLHRNTQRLEATL